MTVTAQALQEILGRMTKEMGLHMFPKTNIDDAHVTLGG